MSNVYGTLGWRENIYFFFNYRVEKNYKVNDDEF